MPVDLAHYVLGRSSVLAFNVSSIVGTVFATFFRFWAYRRYVLTQGPTEQLALV